MRQGRGRILLGNNTGGGVVMLWLIRFHVLKFGLQLDSLVYTYVVDHMHTQF